MPINSPFDLRASKKPPPPIFPAPGYTTANANCIAIEASKALPPFFIMAAPISLANGWAQLTAALLNSAFFTMEYLYGSTVLPAPTIEGTDWLLTD